MLWAVILRNTELVILIGQRRESAWIQHSKFQLVDRNVFRFRKIPALRMGRWMCTDGHFSKQNFWFFFSPELNTFPHIILFRRPYISSLLFLHIFIFNILYILVSFNILNPILILTVYVHVIMHVCLYALTRQCSSANGNYYYFFFV